MTVRTALELAADQVCSFCGKSKDEIHFLVATKGNDASICDECVSVCIDIMFKAMRNCDENGNPNLSKDSVRGGPHEDGY